MRYRIYLVGILLYLLGIALDAHCSGYIQVQVWDAESAMPLASAEIKGSPGFPPGTTNSTGSCVLSNLPEGVYTLSVRRIGYRQGRLDSVRVVSGDTVRCAIALSPSFFLLPEMVVFGVRGDRVGVSHQVMSDRGLRMIPTMAEGDLTRALEDLPGIVSANEFSGDLYVQGGDSDENRMILDGVRILFPSHLGGSISAFNTYAIQNVDVYYAGFPATYGDALSSVIEVHTKRGRPGDQVRGRGCLGLLSSQIALWGGLGSRTGWMVSARRTYYDVLAALFDQTVPFYIYDFCGSVAYNLSSRDKIVFRGFLSRDVFQFDGAEAEDPSSEPEDGRWGNTMLSLTWERIWNKRWVSRFALSSVQYDLRMDEMDVEQARHRVVDQTAQGRFSWVASKERMLHVGLTARRTGFRYYWTDFEQDFDVSRFFDHAPPYFDYKRTLREYTAYADYLWQPSQRVSVRPGLRLALREGETDAAVSPRFSLSYTLSPLWTLTAATGIYRQSTAAVNDRGHVTLFDILFPTERLASDERSFHTMAELRYTAPALTLSLTSYLKRGAGILLSRDAQPGFDRGSTRATGVVLSMERKVGALQGRLHYAWARSTTTLRETTYPAHSDRPHQLLLMGQYALTPSWHLSMRWTAKSGHPFTPAEALFRERRYDPFEKRWDDGFIESAHSPSVQTNSARYPWVHRLDLSVKKTWKYSWGSISLITQLMNAYARKNVLFFNYETEYETLPTEPYREKLKVRRKAVGQFPLLPAFSMEVSF